MTAHFCSVCYVALQHENIMMHMETHTNEERHAALKLWQAAGNNWQEVLELERLLQK
jgi:hypothetical protein